MILIAESTKQVIKLVIHLGNPGTYNVDCAACGGSGKIRQSLIADLDEAAADRELTAQEDGVWEPGVRDYRYGTSSR